RALAKLLESPYVKIGLEQAKALWANPPVPQLQQAKEFLDMPNNRQLWDMLGDAFSQEVFLFGDDSVATVVEILNQLGALNRTARIEVDLGGETREDYLKREILSILADYSEDLSVPTFVMGMKVSDKDRANAQLIRLESLVVPLAD